MNCNILVPINVFACRRCETPFCAFCKMPVYPTCDNCHDLNAQRNTVFCMFCENHKLFADWDKTVIALKIDEVSLANTF